MMKKMFFAAIAAMCACSAQARKWGGPMVTGPDPAGRDKIDAIIRDWKPADAAKPRRVLVCDICAGYRHGDAIGYARYALMRANGRVCTFDYAQDMDELTSPETLARYDAILFNCQTATKVKSFPGLEDALLDFVSAGKGLCLVHAAVDSFYDSPAIQRMNGGLFWGHPWNAGGTWRFVNEKPDDPVNAPFKPLGSPYLVSDEIYMQCTPPYNRADLRVLHSIDLSHEPSAKALANWKGAKRTDGDFAVSWVKTFGKGRVFYTSYGHDRRTWLDPVRVQFILNGLQFAIGDLANPVD